jgi:ribosomal protein L11 methyltransferase
MPDAAADRHSSVVGRFPVPADNAQRVLGELAEGFDSPDVVTTAFEDAQGLWTIAIHFHAPPNETAVRALVAYAAGTEAANALVFEIVATRDWVTTSLEGLKPVAAGRFVVHGAHDRARIPINRIGIEIEAALAFGTGHHGTTRGCLLALDRIAKQRTKRPCSKPPPERGRSTAQRSGGSHFFFLSEIPRDPHLVAFGDRPPPFRGRLKRGALRSRPALPHILDIGTGSGVLAIAAAKALHRPVLASDIDIVAVRAARANAWRNRAGAAIVVLHATGLGARPFRMCAPFDLVFANILLRPLQLMTAPMARLTAPGGRVVLSGLLLAQAPAALATYRIQGLALEQRISAEGWATLVLARPMIKRTSGRLNRGRRRARGPR